MSIFSNIEKAQVTPGGVYFEPGLYEVEVKAVKLQPSSRDSRIFFIVETRITKSNNPERPVGSSCSQVIDYGKQMGPVNVKAFLAALLEVDPGSATLNEDLRAAWKEMTGNEDSVVQILEAVVGPDQPCAGAELRLECVHTRKRDGGIFTKHTWAPLS